MKHNKHNKCKFTYDQAGELIVIGKDIVEIQLQHRSPEEVFVDFSDEAEIIPCNPNHFDGFEFEVLFKHNRYVLKIRWNVSDIREIVWAVRY